MDGSRPETESTTSHSNHQDTTKNITHQSNPPTDSLSLRLQSLSLARHSEASYVPKRTSFILPETVQFGYHETSHSKQMILTEDRLSATKSDPASQYAHGVCYGAVPLRGTAEFEVEITSYGTGWSGTMKLGVMRCPTDSKINVPRYSPESTEHVVWSSTKIHNRLSGGVCNGGVDETEKQYSNVNLDDLKVGSRLGFRLSYDGALSFLVNGKSQGVAAENVYLRGHDVYAVVDHYANCKATRIIRAGT